MSTSRFQDKEEENKKKEKISGQITRVFHIAPFKLNTFIYGYKPSLAVHGRWKKLYSQLLQDVWVGSRNSLLCAQ